MAVISVVIPALNDSAMLRLCLDALAAQTRPADEIVVVDNGSTDDTAEVARRAGARVVVEPRRGIPAATAAGFDAARGDIIGRLDADSRPYPDWLSEIEARFAADPALAAITGPGEFYDASPVVKRLGESLWIGGMFWSMRVLLGHSMLFGSNFAMTDAAWHRVRRTAHRSMRKVHDDLDLSLQFDPGMRIEFDRDLRVGISARPFRSWSGFVRRVYWVWTTLAANSHDRPLLERRADYLEGDRDRLAIDPAFGAEDLSTGEFGGAEFGTE